MTHSGGKPHRTGDEGQQYEVTYVDPRDKKRKVLGWASTAEGASAMCASIHLNPGMHSPKVKDRVKNPDPVVVIPVVDTGPKRSYDEDE